mgnify:CR=1 FL=1
MIKEAHQRGSSFLHEVIENTPGGEQLMHCLQCGSCGGSCPNGADMQYTPRTIFALINAEVRHQEDHIELNASKNYASPRNMEAQGSLLTNKYSEA